MRQPSLGPRDQRDQQEMSQLLPDLLDLLMGLLDQQGQPGQLDRRASQEPRGAIRSLPDPLGLPADLLDLLDQLGQLDLPDQRDSQEPRQPLRDLLGHRMDLRDPPALLAVLPDFPMERFWLCFGLLHLHRYLDRA